MDHEKLAVGQRETGYGGQAVFWVFSEHLRDKAYKKRKFEADLLSRDT